MDFIKFPLEINEIDSKLNERLKKDFLGKQDDYVHIGPNKYLYSISLKYAIDKIYNFKVRPDDVYIATFPRSGTTLTQELVWLLLNNLDYKSASEELLDKRSPYVEYDGLISRKTVEKIKNDNLTQIKELNELKDLINPRDKIFEEMKSPRVLKTHLPMSMIPVNVFKQNCKIIYVARNPLDVAVSNYHQNRLYKIVGYVGDFDRYWESFKNNEIPDCPHTAHVLEAWNIKDKPNILFLFYEDFIKNFDQVLDKITKFLDKKLTKDEINKLKDHLNIENFRKNPSVNDEIALKSGFANSGEEKFIRNGKILGNKELQGERLKSALKWMDEQLKGSDLRYPIDDVLKEILNTE